MGQGTSGRYKNYDGERPSTCSKTVSSKEERLRQVLLSPTARSDVSQAAVRLKENCIPTMSDAVITALFTSNVPGVAQMLDRCDRYPICHYICLSYQHGIPAQSTAPALHQYTKLALRYILHHVSDKGDHTQHRVKILSAIAEAYQGCQQVQARTIDKLFGTMTGRDKGLRGQLFEFIDFIKQQTLDEVTLKLHPGCLTSSPSITHIQSAYVTACGEALGLRGVETSKVDRNRPRLGQRQLDTFVRTYRQAFPVQDVVQAFVRDVNHANASPDRVVDHDGLFTWCREASDAHGMNAQRIFFDEERPELYADCGGAPPQGSNADSLRAPWLHPEVAQDILLLCFENADACKGSGKF